MRQLFFAIALSAKLGDGPIGFGARFRGALTWIWRMRDNGAAPGYAGRCLPGEEEWSMKSFHKSCILAVSFLQRWRAFLHRRRSEVDSVIRGADPEISPSRGGACHRALSDQGAKVETKTDASGNYIFRNLRPGIFTVRVMLPAPNPPYEVQCRVQGGPSGEAKVDLNFKDIPAKQGAEYQAAAKKNDEAKQSLESLKTRVAAGDALVAQERQVKTDLGKAPADQRDALKQKLTDLSNQAVTEFKEAQKRLGEKDPNAALVSFKLGDPMTPRGATRKPQKRTSRLSL